jgi:hypothetical protein
VLPPTPLASKEDGEEGDTGAEAGGAELLLLVVVVVVVAVAPLVRAEGGPVWVGGWGLRACGQTGCMDGSDYQPIDPQSIDPPISNNIYIRT